MVVEYIEYEIMVCNTGNVTVNNVMVYDSLLPGSPFDLGTLSPGDCRNVTEDLIHEVTEYDVCLGWINNTANATGDDYCGDPISTDKNGTWNVSTTYSSSLEIIKTGNTIGPVGFGDEIEYEIMVCNTGNVTVYNVMVYDSLLAGSPFDIGILNATECRNVSESLIYRVTEEDACSGWINNTANATGDDYCGIFIETDKNGTWNVSTGYVASIDVTKEANTTGPFNLSQVIEYTIVVNNTGNVNLTNVTVEDDLTRKSWNIADPFEPGKPETFKTTHTVNQTDMDRGYIINNATVQGKDICGETREDIDTVIIKNEELHNLTITKAADKLSVQECDEVTYTITVCNWGDGPEYNVTVWDVFDRRVEILSMTPTPDPDGKWHFGVLQPGECREIKIKIRVPERQDFEFGMDQGVSGEGFVKVANDYSTTFEAYLIKNCAYVTSDFYTKPLSACACVRVGEDLGTELQTREYGSGLFDAEERVAVFTENKSIEWEEDVSATYKPTSITLYQNRTVDYDSAWVKKARAKNYITGTTMTETYHDASWLDRESRMFLDKNESVMEVDSAFDGRGHVGFLKMPTNRSSPQTTPLIEVREEYVGSFKVVQKIDEYGKGVSYEKAASGGGLVVGDRRIGSTQRSYESGSGSYDSEEVIETYTSYIAKDISLVYAPTTTRLTDDVWINSSMKWKEGIYSRVPERSYIGEEYTGASELDKETVARGLNEMDTVADFSGQARYRAVFADPNDTAEPFIEFDEAYSGDYSIERRVLLTGTSKYDRPHLNVTKTLDGIVEERDRCDGDNCTKTKQVATYTIRIENDGNSALGPIYVRDLFPPGAVFIESSLRPSELTETTANWTLTHIAIGGAIEIVVKLDVTKYYPSEIVNRVEVCGGKDVDWVCFGNYSAWEMNWLTCCLNETVSVVKTGEVDEANGSVVRYRIEIDNLDAVTRVATVTDHLPAGMTFLESSTAIASYDGVEVVWSLIDIGPFETRTIEFSALAPEAGRYTNAVIVDPRSVDGPVVGPVTARCVVEVGSAEECGPISCGGWSPPNWDLQHSGNEPDEMTCDQLTGTGTGSCPAP
ncbi:MAG: hypothetical protein A4E50_01678 [Methanosaeta sp. PtaB.Bin087]|nr:MAG: hypothetical protein A4E50_01678 [Methanosaeta sp. PtaB.Bin087]